jgi:hypothetical protein
MSRTPWVGLAALTAMFVIPYLPAWFFEGPRTVKHWPRRHVCGDCNGSWTDGHTCVPTNEIPLVWRGELRRLKRTADLKHVSDSQALAPGQRGVTADSLASRDR